MVLFNYRTTIMIVGILILILFTAATCSGYDSFITTLDEEEQSRLLHQDVDLRSSSSTEYSWFATLYVKRESDTKLLPLPCSAALISPEFVLTSSKCIEEEGNNESLLFPTHVFTPAT